MGRRLNKILSRIAKIITFGFVGYLGYEAGTRRREGKKFTEKEEKNLKKFGIGLLIVFIVLFLIALYLVL